MNILLVFAAVAAAQTATPAPQPAKAKADKLVCSWEVSRGGLPYKVCSSKREREERSFEVQKEVRIMQQRATQSSNL